MFGKISELFEATSLGIVQGLTEFLPISSTAHLVLVPHFLKWKTPGLVFDTSLHLGTLVAVLYYFRKDISDIALAWMRSFKKDANLDEEQKQLSRLAWFIILGTIPAGLAGVSLEKVVEHTLRTPLVIAVSLIVGGLLLYLVDRKHSGDRDLSQIDLKTTLMVGFSQAVALIPGVSRSGITMTAGLFSGLTRESAARFSFLLGIPVIAAGGIFKLKDLAGHTLDGALISYFSAGFLAAAVSGYLCIRFLIQYLQTHNFNIFVGYRVALGTLIFLLSQQLSLS